MFNRKSHSKIFAIVFFSLLQMSLIYAQEGALFKSRSLTPSVVIHDTVIGPDQILLQVDAFDFVGDDGQVAAITLRINIDTLLLDFQGIQNPSLSGSWLANYNEQQHEITITYTAPFGQSSDVNGKLLDLNLNYQGGFDAELNFKPWCEISNVNLQTIDSITYINGLISQVNPEGIVFQDTISIVQGQIFNMPIVAQGDGFDLVTEMKLRVSYDTLQLLYLGHTNELLTSATVEESLDILTINWDGLGSSVDLTEADTLMYLQFQSISDSNSMTKMLPGSAVYNNGTLVASDFIDGQVLAILSVELFNQPDTAGMAIGAGNYFIGDSVFIQAIPETGFSFVEWTSADTLVSSEMEFVYIKQRGSDSLTAHYSPNPYEVSIEVTPLGGGTAEGAGIYPFGDFVTLTAMPELGYEFICWIMGSDILSYDMSYSFSMPSNDIALTASFGLSTYTVNVAPNNPAYGSTVGGGDYLYGTIATVTAIPAPGYHFVLWSENGQAISNDSLYEFAVTQDRNLVGNFQLLSDCSAPVGLFADPFSENEALLYWLPSGNEDVWDLIWGISGFDTISGGNLISDLTLYPYSLDNLDPGTTYDFYVRAHCFENVLSPWSEVSTFTTWYVGVDHEAESSVKVYPNPVHNSLHIKIQPYNATGLNYRIVNLMGETVLEGKSDGNQDISIDVTQLYSGMYWLRLENDLFSKTCSIVVN